MKCWMPIIIGTGSGGLAALQKVRKHTQNFVIINDGPWGIICALNSLE